MGEVHQPAVIDQGINIRLVQVVGQLAIEVVAQSEGFTFDSGVPTAVIRRRALYLTQCEGPNGGVFRRPGQAASAARAEWHIPVPLLIEVISFR